MRRAQAQVGQVGQRDQAAAATDQYGVQQWRVVQVDDDAHHQQDHARQQQRKCRLALVLAKSEGE